MAVSLKGEDFGRLVDPFGGRRDLEARTIRVLHNLSFIDDPTRIFRAIRYENRYGFRMDEHTIRLARGCVEMGLVGDLSSARLRGELEALLEEGEVEHSILRLAEIGVATAVHPHLAADEEAVRLLERLRELRDELARRRAGLAARARGAGAEAAAGRALRVARAPERPPPRRRGDRAGGDRRAEARRAARARPGNRRRWPRSPTGCRRTRSSIALALEDSDALRSWFRSLRDVRLEVTGRDLAELGLGESPRVGEVLAELRRRKLNGELDGRESELDAARELIARS